MADSHSDQENEVTLRIPKSTLDLLRCAVCRKYLSSSPVFSYDDGRNVCNLCYDKQPLSVKEKKHCWNTLYAKAVKYFGFPCKYSDLGCKEIVRFNDTLHQKYCEYRLFGCPVNKNDGFEGTVKQILSHLTLDHSSMIIEGNNNIIFTITKQLVIHKQTKIMPHTGTLRRIKSEDFPIMYVIEFDVYTSKHTENQILSVNVIEINDRKNIKTFYSVSFQPDEDKDTLFQRNKLAVSKLVADVNINYKQNITQLFEIFHTENVHCKISIETGASCRVP